MKNLNTKLLLAAFLAVFVGNVGAVKIEEVLAKLSFLEGKTNIEEQKKEKKETTDWEKLTKSRKRVSFSADDKNLEMLVKQIVLFNNLNLETIEKFENKFMDTFSDKDIAGNALKYMNLVVDSHNENLKTTKESLDIDKLQNGFFKLAWRIKWAEDNKMFKLVERRKKIFNTFIVFVTGITGGFNADKWAMIQLDKDEQKEVAEIILKIQAFNPALIWPEGKKIAGFPVLIQ